MYSSLNSDALTAFMAVLGLVSIMLILCGIIMSLASIIANWRIFQKAGQPGWAALIPFYNLYVMADITWGNGWVFLVVLVCLLVSSFVSSLSWICVLLLIAFETLTCWKLSKAFGHGIGFAVGLALLPTIFSLVLAFNNDVYTGVPQDGLCFSKNDKR